MREFDIKKTMKALEGGVEKKSNENVTLQLANETAKRILNEGLKLFSLSILSKDWRESIIPKHHSKGEMINKKLMDLEAKISEEEDGKGFQMYKKEMESLQEEAEAFFNERIQMYKNELKNEEAKYQISGLGQYLEGQFKEKYETEFDNLTMENGGKALIEWTNLLEEKTEKLETKTKFFQTVNSMYISLTQLFTLHIYSHLLHTQTFACVSEMPTTSRRSTISR
jgi:hypothetical protein